MAVKGMMTWAALGWEGDEAGLPAREMNAKSRCSSFLNLLVIILCTVVIYVP